MSRNTPPKALRDIPKDGCEGDYLVEEQPRSQGLSSSPLSLAPGDGKKRDPGNEVGQHLGFCLTDQKIVDLF